MFMSSFKSLKLVCALVTKYVITFFNNFCPTDNFYKFEQI